VAVQIVERFVLAKLRHRRFFSLAELNAAIRDCVAVMSSDTHFYELMRHPVLRGVG
ncbi:MAG: IS21 family transposase, partial [Alphaproteobacteria bacterium]|nr:IS21 family transposase [Alphaproteobacteria bacterium]